MLAGPGARSPRRQKPAAPAGREFLREFCPTQHNLLEKPHGALLAGDRGPKVPGSGPERGYDLASVVGVYFASRRP